MTVTIAPFTADHVDPAAALLAARHRRHRRLAPALSPEYEHSAGTLPVLQELLAKDGTSGVVALRGGELVAYLLGAPELGSPTQPFAGFMRPRAAEIPYAGHAADPEDGCVLYPRLYAALARQWVTDGFVGHYITVSHDPVANETWWNLGFGRSVAMGVRSTTLPAETDTPCGEHFEVRRATIDDEEAVFALATEFFRSVADPPIFVPYLPETSVERRRFVAEHLADPTTPFWLACVDGRPVGMQLFEEPTSPHWHQSKLQTPQRAVYLFLACTVPEARSTGIGAALFARTMASAREAGYDVCMVHWLTTSRAAQFWRGLGFQPVSYWLSRFVDERVTWAHDWT